MRRWFPLAIVVGIFACVQSEPSVNSVTLGCDSTTKKQCDGRCVDKTDPAFGCSSASCAPCALVNAQLEVCQPDGRCAAVRCLSRWGDCDGDPTNGCERDLLSVADCGACGKVCEGGALCSKQGCVESCKKTEGECHGTCVDYQTDELHCGGCDAPVCVNPDPNGVAACVGGSCTVACKKGYMHCAADGSDPCQPIAKIYPDVDKDGFGGGSGVSGCIQPSGWVSVGGDCNDQNPDVFPGQTKYFTSPYAASSSASSFDYDCSGTETAAPGFVLGNCGPQCVPGYQKTARTGVGVDPGCGSTAYYGCTSAGPVACSPLVRPAYGCH